MRSAPDRRLGITFAFVCLGILGVMPILASDRPAAYDGLTFAIFLTGWQLLSALPLFLREHAVRMRHAAPRAVPAGGRARSIAIALSTGAMFGLSTYMYVVAATEAGPVSMAIALQAYPLFAIVLEAVLLGRRKSAAELAFTALMIAALYYLTTHGTLRVAEVSWWSVFALGIPLLWSVAHILLKRLIETTAITPSQVTVTRLAVSGIFLLALAFALGDPAALVKGLTDLPLQKAAFLLGLAYYLELIFWFHAMRHIDVSLGSSLTVPAPAVTMLVAVLFVGDPIAPYQVVAVAVIIVALYGLLYAGRRARRPEPV